MQNELSPGEKHMDNGSLANWVARVEYEAREREQARQERLLDDIRHDEYVSVPEPLHAAAQQKPSTLTSTKGAARWRMPGLRSVLARLL